MRLSAVVLTAALAAASIASVPASASSLIVNGGFETGDFTGWTTANLVFTQVAPSGIFGYSAHGGSYYAALGDGSTGTLSQTFSDTAGQQYQLAFFLASDGKTPNELSASVDGNTLFDGVNIAKTGASSPYPYTQYTFNFNGTGSDTLTFGEVDIPSFLALDDISVTPLSTSPVPEPSPLLLLATALAALLPLSRPILRPAKRGK